MNLAEKEAAQTGLKVADVLANITNLQPSGRIYAFIRLLEGGRYELAQVVHKANLIPHQAATTEGNKTIYEILKKARPTGLAYHPIDDMFLHQMKLDYCSATRADTLVPWRSAISIYLRHLEQLPIRLVAQLSRIDPTFDAMSRIGLTAIAPVSVLFRSDLDSLVWVYQQLHPIFRRQLPYSSVRLMLRQQRRLRAGLMAALNQNMARYVIERL